MKTLKQIRTSYQQIFPFPEEGEIVWETPPCLIWLAEEENAEYTVTLRNNEGFFWQGTTWKNFITPDVELVPGDYEWNLTIENAERGWKSFTIAEEAVEFHAPDGKAIYEAVPERKHPRHLFYKEDIPQLLKEHPAELETLQRNVEQAYIDGLPEEPRFWHDEKAVTYREYFGRYRDYVDRNLIACAYGWQLLGDRKAGEHAVKILLTICSWDPAQESALMGQKGDEVGLSNARCLPAAFDMLQDLLSDKECQVVIKAIEAYGEQCEQRLLKTDFVKNPGNSHVGRLPAYLGEAAMILKGTGVDEGKLIRWMELAAEIFGGIFPFYGGSDGSWGEGPFYASSYTKWYLPFFSAVERYTGVSYLERPFYQRLSQYMLHFANPMDEIHPYGDGYWCHSEDPEWPGFMAQDPYRLYARKFGPLEAIAVEKALPQPEVFHLHLLDIFLPVGSVPDHHITGMAQNAAAFHKAGVLDLCSSFDSGEPVIKAMLRASRYGSGSHSHADQGSFALFYNGTALITPSGYFGWAYGTEHHQKWTKTTKAHNCILVDGEGQPVHSHIPVGKILSCEQSDSRYTAEVEVEGYEKLNTWRRKLTMDALKHTLVVEDVIVAKEDVEIEWLLHSLGEPGDQDGITIIERHGIRLEITVQEGLQPEAVLSDTYDVDLNAGLPKEQHVTMPQQYHMKWTTPARKKEHRIRVLLKIR